MNTGKLEGKTVKYGGEDVTFLGWGIHSIAKAHIHGIETCAIIIDETGQPRLVQVGDIRFLAETEK